MRPLLVVIAAPEVDQLDGIIPVYAELIEGLSDVIFVTVSCPVRPVRVNESSQVIQEPYGVGFAGARSVATIGLDIASRFFRCTDLTRQAGECCVGS
jgi:hypothetical protein